MSKGTFKVRKSHNLLTKYHVDMQDSSLLRHSCSSGVVDTFIFNGFSHVTRYDKNVLDHLIILIENLAVRK